MSWLDFVVLTLAASAIVDVWRNGSIFADLRALAEAKADASESPSQQSAAPIPETSPPESLPLPRWLRIVDRCMPRIVAEMLTCDFCVSHHAPLWVLLLLFVPAALAEDPVFALALKAPAYALAATRLGNIFNALLPPGSRYDREDFDEATHDV